MKYLPIRHLFLRESLLVVGLGGLGLAGAGWWGARAIMIGQAKARAESGLREVERKLESSLGEAKRTGEALAQLGRLGQLAGMDRMAGEAQLLAELRSRPSLSNLTFVRPDGQASAANAPEVEHGNLWITRGTHLDHAGRPQRLLHLWNWDNQLVFSGPDPVAPMDWRQRPWVVQGLAQGHGAWTSAYQFLGPVGFGLTYTLPVFQGSRPLGVLGVDLVLGDIRPWLNLAKPTQGTLIAILDRDGRLLVPPEQGETPPGGRLRILALEPLDARHHPVPFAVHRAQNAGAGVWPRITVAGESYLVQRRSLSLGGGLDWEILAAIPEGDLLHEPRKLALLTLGLSLVALAFLAWRMAWGSRKVSLPLERLAAQAELLVEDQLITTPTTRIMEVQHLARALRVASLALQERAGLEAQLRVAQRREMIGTLAAGVAHDLGNLLLAVSANLELAQTSDRSEEARNSSLEQAGKALRRSQGFLRALLSIGRPGATEPRAMELGTLLEEVGALVEPLLGGWVTLERVLPREPVWIHGDPPQMEQVLLNLAMNGRDAMAQGGLLRMEAGLGPDGRPFLAVQDAGHGISPEVKRQLFTPFFTTKAEGKGSGLGLAMVQGIARSHHAEIEVESSPGQGSRFTLRFPPAEPPPSHSG